MKPLDLRRPRQFLGTLPLVTVRVFMFWFHLAQPFLFCFVTQANKKPQLKVLIKEYYLTCSNLFVSLVSLWLFLLDEIRLNFIIWDTRPSPVVCYTPNNGGKGNLLNVLF